MNAPSSASDSSATPSKRPLPTAGMMLLVVALLVVGWWLKQQEEKERGGARPVAEVTHPADSTSGDATNEATSKSASKSPSDSKTTNTKSSPFEDEPDTAAPPVTSDAPPTAEVKPRGVLETKKETIRPPPSSNEVATAAKTEPSKPGTNKPDLTKISDVTIRDEDGRIVYRGPVDLQPTLDRIASGRKLSYRNDGSVFQNREGRLPRKSSGYYHEWVHPTPKVSGPGAQRIVTGEAGEVYYTHDHYKSFRTIRQAAR